MKTIQTVSQITAIVYLLAAAAQGADSDATRRREHIERTTERVLHDHGRSMEVTSRYRDDSEAHKRGASDIRSKDIPRPERHSEARDISRALGRGHTVIVEERNVPPLRSGYQMNTSYRDGQPVRSSAQPARATETHTHIQPDRTVTPARRTTPTR
jgi:hypothetical protein